MRVDAGDFRLEHEVETAATAKDYGYRDPVVHAGSMAFADLVERHDPASNIK